MVSKISYSRIALRVADEKSIGIALFKLLNCFGFKPLMGRAVAVPKVELFIAEMGNIMTEISVRGENDLLIRE